MIYLARRSSAGRLHPGQPALWRAWLLGSAAVSVGLAAAFAQAPADTPASAAAEPASLEDVMPAALREPALDPFAGARTLQAHQLRGLTAEVVGLILRKPPGGEIAFEALATPLRGEGGKAEVSLFIEIDGSTFLESNQSSTARVEVYAYALGTENQVAGFMAEVFAVDVQEKGEAIWQSGLKFYGHLDLPAGEYRLRVLIRNYQSGASGLREVALEVPAFDALQRPFVLLPLFPPPTSRDAWWPVRESRAPAEYPFVAGEEALNPAVRPVLVSGRRFQAHLFGYDLPPGQPGGRVELLQGGTVVAGAPLSVESRRPASGRGPEEIEIYFDSPQIDPGVYSLRVDLAGGAVSAAAPVVVLPRGATDRGLLWTDLRGNAGGDPAAAASTAAEPRAADAETDREQARGKKKIGRAERRAQEAAKRQEEERIRRLADSYRQTLVTMARGQRSAARGALLDLESSVLADGSLKALQTAQLSVAEGMATNEAESLIPVLVLHDDVYQVYRQRNLFSLGSNARGMIENLAELYAERGGTQGSAVVAARALASLGGHLQQANLPASSRRLYERALAHDPANLAALLGLATSFERYGDYPQAVAILETLVAAHPRFAEGLLRLAVNLDRLGVRARSKELLSRAAELEAPNWVHSLVHQRLARIAFETGDLDHAAQLLEASLAEDPDQHGSVYLLAHVYDRRREAYKALELLQGIAPAATGGDSARKHYDSWPEDVLAATRHELSEAAQVRLDLLARTLGGGAGK